MDIYALSCNGCRNRSFVTLSQPIKAKQQAMNKNIFTFLFILKIQSHTKIENRFSFKEAIHLPAHIGFYKVAQ